MPAGSQVYDELLRRQFANHLVRGLLDGSGLFGGSGDDDNNDNPLDSLSISIPSVTVPTLSLGIPDLFSTSSSTSSGSSTIASSTASSTSASTSSSSSASSVTSSALTTSSTSSSSIASSSASSTSSSSTDSSTPSPAPTVASASPTIENDSSPQTSTVVVNASESSAAPTGAVAPTSFMENKPLSISVITIASIIGFVILVIIGTWALRRRSRRKLHAEAATFSNDDMAGGSSGYGDLEKGTGQGLGRGDDILDRVAAAAEARQAPSVHRVATNRSTGTTTTETYVHSSEGHGYNLPKAGYGDAYDFGLPHVQEPGPIVVPGYDAREYGHGYLDAENKAPAHFRLSGPYLPNPFENTEPPRAPTPAYDFAPMPPATPTRDLVNSHSHSLTRKPTPPFLTVDVEAASEPIMGGPPSAVSMTGSPMQAADAVNPANPAPSPSLVESPKSLNMRRSSLLDGPSRSPTGADSTAREAKRRSSHSRVLDPSIPPVPVAPPLPDAFGRGQSLDNKRTEPLRLKVVNA